MPLEIPIGYAHIAIEHRHTLDPEPWYVTFGVDTTDFVDDITAIGNRAHEAYWTAFGAGLSQDVDVTGAEVTLGQEDAEPIRAFVARTANGTGISGASKLPQNCALLIRKNSALGGRRNRGRMFVPGILNEGDVNAVGILPPATVGELETAADLFRTGLLASGADPELPMVILHSSGISETPLPTPVTTLSVDNVISTQRRRLR